MSRGGHDKTPTQQADGSGARCEALWQVQSVGSKLHRQSGVRPDHEADTPSPRGEGQPATGRQGAGVAEGAKDDGRSPRKSGHRGLGIRRSMRIGEEQHGRKALGQSSPSS